MKQKKKRERRIFSAMEKCKAVLAVWTERRNITETCLELRINSMTFSKWQDRAMEGMMKALDSGSGKEERPPLTNRLEKLLSKKNAQMNGAFGRLEQRLEKIGQSRELPEKQNSRKAS